MIPNYYIGTLEGKYPIYCNVEETIVSGRFTPHYTFKKKFKLHISLMANPRAYFDNELLNLPKLLKFIEDQFKLPKDVFLRLGYDGNLHLEIRSIAGDEHGSFDLIEHEKFSSSFCPFIKCSKIVIVYQKGIIQCPHCNKSFFPE